MNTTYTGRTTHRRHRPEKHAFVFDLSMVMVDADRIGGPTARLDLGHGRVVDRRDLFDGDTSTLLGDAIRDLVERRTGCRPHGHVRTLCIARSAGYSFNPLTVHWVMSSDGDRPEVVVLEVTNTPWKERHSYVLDARNDARGGDGSVIARRSPDGVITADFAKELHVSPFGRMDEYYEATVSPPGDRIAVELRNRAADGDPVMTARLDLRASADTPSGWRQRLLSRRVWSAIHWQAFRLLCKRVPVQTHPDKAGARSRRMK